jgi:hypothetical protein
MPTPQEFYDDDLYLIANKSAVTMFELLIAVPHYPSPS